MHPDIRKNEVLRGGAFTSDIGVLGENMAIIGYR